MSDALRQTDKTTISRHSERATYDREVACAILDEGLVAHVGVSTPNGVIVIPMTYARLDDELVIHGAVASRWLNNIDDSLPISICVTLLDGLVLARSAFSHSMNYRSVVAYGTARLLKDKAEKQAAFKALVDHMLPGRWTDCKQPDDKEIAATTVLAMKLDEASVKIRSGPPKDAEKDMDQPYWAGVIPLGIAVGTPQVDPAYDGDAGVPEYASNYSRG
ncbi:MAG: pyridoxamine 5'-phosphate oxidase family protein [Gammaproteobacteria bacterium]|nr:pyridoxamine 5'-phosphate oxidase family protein [Gammaproteobacteria bacterium]